MQHEGSNNGIFEHTPVKRMNLENKVVANGDMDIIDITAKKYLPVISEDSDDGDNNVMMDDNDIDESEVIALFRYLWNPRVMKGQP